MCSQTSGTFHKISYFFKLDMSQQHIESDNCVLNSMESRGAILSFVRFVSVSKYPFQVSWLAESRWPRCDAEQARRGICVCEVRVLASATRHHGNGREMDIFETDSTQNSVPELTRSVPKGIVWSVRHHLVLSLCLCAIMNEQSRLIFHLKVTALNSMAPVVLYIARSQWHRCVGQLTLASRSH